MRVVIFGLLRFALIAAVAEAACLSPSKADVYCGSSAGHIKDEALCVGRMANSLAAADEDYFRDRTMV